MTRLIAVAMFAVLLSLEVTSSAQDQQPAPNAPASPSAPSAPSAQPQTEPAPSAAQTPAPAPASGEDQTATPPPANPPSPTPKPAETQNPPAKTPAPSHKKVVVRNGGAKDQSAQLAPGMSKEQESQSRQATSHLLAITDANVKSVAGRQLTLAQQGMLDQIRTYMKQSKQASDLGDLARAHTLADKAHLLSDELRK